MHVKLEEKFSRQQDECDSLRLNDRCQYSNGGGRKEVEWRYLKVEEDLLIET